MFKGLFFYELVLKFKFCFLNIIKYVRVLEVKKCKWWFKWMCLGKKEKYFFFKLKVFIMFIKFFLNKSFKIKLVWLFKSFKLGVLIRMFRVNFCMDRCLVLISFWYFSNLFLMRLDMLNLVFFFKKFSVLLIFIGFMEKIIFKGVFWYKSVLIVIEVMCLFL